MKKNLFYFAMALCVALCNVACSSDDDGDDNGGKYTAPKYTEQATAFVISEGVVEAVAGGETASLTGVNLTEGGKAVIEVEIDGAKKVVTYDVVYESDGTYTIKDGNTVLGTIKKVVVSRASGKTVSLQINFRVFIVGYGWYNFAPSEITAAVEKAKTNNGGDIISTWKLTRMKLTIEFDEEGKKDVSTEVESGKLHDFITLAEDNGVNLTADEKKSLNREVMSFIIDDFSTFTITYKDGGSDAANWKWDGSKNKLIITLKNSEMGNKFLQDNSTIEVKYPGDNKLIMKMKTRLEDDKCNATLTVNLSK